MGKYAPLTRFLREQAQPRITLRFGELEEILGFSLPESAYRYPAWWANSAKGQSQVKGWRDAGWETRDVDLRGRKVTFVRVTGEPVGRAHEEGKAEAGKGEQTSPARMAQADVKPLPANVCDVTRLPPGMRRLLESRAARNGRVAALEMAAILQAALEEERAALMRDLAGMRQRTQRPGAFDLLTVLERK